MSDETTPKWDCDIVSHSDVCCLQDNNFDDIDVSQEKHYIGKTLRILKDTEMIPNARYFSEDGIYNDFFNTWGYVDRFMFSVIPNSDYADNGNDACLGVLIAVIE